MLKLVDCYTCMCYLLSRVNLKHAFQARVIKGIFIRYGYLVEQISGIIVHFVMKLANHVFCTKTVGVVSHPRSLPATACLQFYQELSHYKMLKRHTCISNFGHAFPTELFSTQQDLTTSSSLKSSAVLNLNNSLGQTHKLN